MIILPDMLRMQTSPETDPFIRKWERNSLDLKLKMQDIQYLLNESEYSDELNREEKELIEVFEKTKESYIDLQKRTENKKTSEKKLMKLSLDVTKLRRKITKRRSETTQPSVRPPVPCTTPASLSPSTTQAAPSLSRDSDTTGWQYPFSRKEKLNSQIFQRRVRFPNPLLGQTGNLKSQCLQYQLLPLLRYQPLCQSREKLIPQIQRQHGRQMTTIL